MGLPAKKSDISTAPLALNETLAREIIREARRTFREMFRTEAKPGRYRLGDGLPISGDVSGTVGLVQDRVEGTMTISFELEAIIGILKTIYGKDFSAADKPVLDGVGEITNIMYCLVKKYLNENGHRLRTAIPSVVMGTAHNVISLHRRGHSLQIPFQVPGGKFHVQITLRNS